MADRPPVLILAGGRGARLRPLTDTTAKVLLPVCGRPFIDHVVDALTSQGFEDLVVSVGWSGELVEQHLGDGRHHGASVRYVREDRPLGTGGAVRHALRSLPRRFVLAFGDVLLDARIDDLLDAHHLAGHGATLATTVVDDRARYGSVVLSGERFVTIREKLDAGPGAIFAGVCVLEREFVMRAPARAFPLTDLFVRHPAEVGCAPVDGEFVDMGTPEELTALRNGGVSSELLTLRPADPLR